MRDYDETYITEDSLSGVLYDIENSIMADHIGVVEALNKKVNILYRLLHAHLNTGDMSDTLLAIANQEDYKSTYTKKEENNDTVLDNK